MIFIIVSALRGTQQALLLFILPLLLDQLIVTATGITITCPDQCWDGKNCHLYICQPCPFSCPPQNYSGTSSNANGNTNAASNQSQNAYNDDDYDASNTKFPVELLPPQCKTINTETCAANSCLYKTDCNKPKCKFCFYCNSNTKSKSKSKSSTSQCQLQITFRDYTEQIFSKTTPTYFNRFKHSGKPYFHDGPPLFFHHDGDYKLDYFNSMHGHPLFTNQDLTNRMELAIGEGTFSNDDNLYNIHNDTTLQSNTTGTHLSSNENDDGYNLRQISNQIIIQESKQKMRQLDLHGSVIADLDQDGFLDLYISNGGNGGYIESDFKYQEAYDNLLFWGEPSTTMFDTHTGKPMTTFRGGRQAAIDANVNMRRGRGRFVYLLDVNHDGLLDLFVSQDRSISNYLSPGYLLINEGNRKWKKDENMQEYARTLMLTDANGDGFADEIVINRSFCFPQRNGPAIDPDYPNLGTFTDNVKSFCSTRPVGTTAIYKFNVELGKMQEISKPFINFWAMKEMQPLCCPHTSYDGSNDCNAIGMASADFDADDLADHILLYKYKMEFYFSSDRNNDMIEPSVGNPNAMGLKITFPNYCGAATALSVVDFDNDGKEEIFITCENAGTFLLYTRDDSLPFESPSYRSSWSLSNGCNDHKSLGDINNRFLASPSLSDLNELCNGAIDSKWRIVKKICLEYNQNKGKTIPAKTTGISIVDLNNDGFYDLAISSTFGYLRIFFNAPFESSSSNQHIAFDLSMETSYGIGNTLILHCLDTKSGKVIKQFREVSTYLHGTDRQTSRDSKIIFGLGQHLKPIKLIVRRPNKSLGSYVEEYSLSDWKSTDAIVTIQSSSPSPTPSCKGSESYTNNCGKKQPTSSSNSSPSLENKSSSPSRIDDVVGLFDSASASNFRETFILRYALLGITILYYLGL